MSLTIRTNIPSIIAQGSLTKSTNALNTAIERMTTGLKINSAKDNAAGYSIVNDMTTKLSSWDIAEDNVKMGIDLLNTAMNSISILQNCLSRIRTLEVQALNGTYGDSSLKAINAEVSALVDEFLRTKNSCEYNGVDLLNGTSTIANEDYELKTDSRGFMKSVQTRDVSEMDALADVSEGTTLSSGTYSISTAEELAKLATMTNSGKIGADCEFVLGADIDLSAYHSGTGWTPIGTLANKFNATFDGNGYIISNLYINRMGTGLKFSGIFGDARNSTIKNLGVKDAEVIADNSGASLLAGTGGSVLNCWSNGSIKNSGTTMNGGLVGQLGVASVESKVENCYSECTINGAGYNGGLIGGIATGVTTTINNCNTNCTINSTGYNNGGLIGASNSGSIVVINNCYTDFNITATCTGTNTPCGGITGTSNGNTTINDCGTKGKIVSTGDFNGGLVGVITKDKTLTITNSYAKTDITGVNKVGGLVGCVEEESGLAASLNIDSSYFIGNISGTSFIGGIVGHVCNNSTAHITNTYSKGSVTGTETAGGFIDIIGKNANVTADNCYSDMLVSAPTSSGFINTLYNNSNVTMTNCNMFGESETTGIFIGEVADGATTVTCNITNCGYNSCYNEKSIPLTPTFTGITVTGARNCTFDEEFTFSKNNNIAIQAGITSDENSRINFSTSLGIDTISSLKGIGLNDFNYLGRIDYYISLLNTKSTDLGSSANRLDSAIDSIQTNYENLVSSRSTLRDTDVAKESSEYIKQQILQQASATLLSTANQTPSIALQLI